MNWRWEFLPCDWNLRPPKIHLLVYKLGSKPNRADPPPTVKSKSKILPPDNTKKLPNLQTPYQALLSFRRTASPIFPFPIILH